MRGSHGWAEINEERKRAIIDGIASGRTTRGPVHAELDLTDRCNVACYFCNQQDVRTKEQISLPHLTALIDQLAEAGVRSVRLSGGGDPLFHREVAQVLDHLHLRDIVIDNLTTNGALLGPEIARRLIEHRAREVLFSLNAVDSADYHRMMQVKPETFSRVTENIRRLIEARGESAYPAVVVQFLLDRGNFRELSRMYGLGASLGADRIAVSTVLDIPLQRIDPEVLLGEADAETLRPHFERILAQDKEAQRLQIYFPTASWNVMIAEIKRQLDYPPEVPLFPTAASFQEKNGHCFFGWYTATIRGNGDLYPCCLLMFPDYKPLGNALDGKFSDHWNGPAFTKMRAEQREVFLAGDEAKFDPARHQVLRPQCVEHGLCWLKNIYFRGDEKFYRELSEALEKARRRARWEHLPSRALRALRSLPDRIAGR